MSLWPPSPGGSAGDPLPVMETVRQGYALLRGHADDLMRLAVVPVGVSFVIDVVALGILFPRGAPEAQPPADPDQGQGGAAGGADGGAVDPAMVTFDPWLLLLLLGFVPMALFAVNWLRVVSAGGAAVPGLGLRWGLRETRFLFRGLGVLLIAALAAAFPMAIGLAVLGRAPGGVPLVFSLGMLGFLYLILRFVFGLVAVALDEGCSLGESWIATKGAGGRFLLVVMLAALPFWMLGLLVPLLLDTVGLYAAAPLSSLLVSNILGYLSPAAAMTAILLVYRRLLPPPPATPTVI